ncbi:MAG: hypothetical protein AAF960_02185 [Bacteroidota bacterium]
MLNRIFKISTLAVLACFLVLTSCEKESLEELTTENFTEQAQDRNKRGKKGKKRAKCFEPVFPITLNFSDGTAAEVADKEAAKEALQTWKEANPDSEERPSIALPYDVTLRDGTTMTLTTQEEVDALRETCRTDRPGGKRKKCFKRVFPYTLNFPDGTATEVADRAEAKAALQAWKAANPDSEERPSVAFPYDVELRDGTTQTITSEADLEALRASCRPSDDDSDNNE